MSRIFEALQQANIELAGTAAEPAESPEGLSAFVAALSGDLAALEEAPTFEIPECLEVRLIAWKEPHSLAAERLRGLAARLRYAQQRRALKRILITSAVRGDGKSTISLNLAITLAMQGEKTLLIDGDLHRPSLASILRIDGQRGFANASERSDSVTNCVQRAERLPLWICPAGTAQDQPLTLVQSPHTAEVLKQLQGWFTWIVIDSPPLAPLSDASVWARLCDGFVLIAREAATPKRALLKGIESLEKSKILALLMNDSNPEEEKYYRDYYKQSSGAAVPVTSRL